jgi:hypothetical protein
MLKKSLFILLLQIFLLVNLYNVFALAPSSDIARKGMVQTERLKQEKIQSLKRFYSIEEDQLGVYSITNIADKIESNKRKFLEYIKGISDEDMKSFLLQPEVYLVIIGLKSASWTLISTGGINILEELGLKVGGFVGGFNTIYNPKSIRWILSQDPSGISDEKAKSILDILDSDDEKLVYDNMFSYHPQVDRCKGRGDSLKSKNNILSYLIGDKEAIGKIDQNPNAISNLIKYLKTYIITISWESDSFDSFDSYSMPIMETISLDKKIVTQMQAILIETPDIKFSNLLENVGIQQTNLAQGPPSKSIIVRSNSANPITFPNSLWGYLFGFDSIDVKAFIDGNIQFKYGQMNPEEYITIFGFDFSSINQSFGFQWLKKLGEEVLRPKKEAYNFWMSDLVKEFSLPEFFSRLSSGIKLKLDDFKIKKEELKGSFKDKSDKDIDIIWNELIKRSYVDKEGRVLSRFEAEKEVKVFRKFKDKEILKTFFRRISLKMKLMIFQRNSYLDEFIKENLLRYLGSEKLDRYLEVFNYENKFKAIEFSDALYEYKGTVFDLFKICETQEGLVTELFDFIQEQELKQSA